VATIQPQADGDVHLVVDFGRELVGFLELELDAPAGATVDVNCFEGIDDTGIYWTWDCATASATSVATASSASARMCGGASVTSRSPSATTRAPCTCGQLSCLLSTYPVEERGRFQCSDALLTRIWQVAADTVRLCMLDTYVDCPAYEQVFWVGDARNSALVNAVAFGAFALSDRCWRLVGQSLSRHLDPLKPPVLQGRPHLTTDHVVSGWFSEIPMWTFLWIWSVWEHYWLSGDREALAAHYDAVAECLERALGFLNDRGLFDIPNVWNLVDWAAMDLPRTGEVTANAALLAAALQRAAGMGEALGRAEDAAVTAAMQNA